MILFRLKDEIPLNDSLLMADGNEAPGSCLPHQNATSEYGTCARGFLWLELESTQLYVSNYSCTEPYFTSDNFKLIRSNVTP